MWEPSIVLGSGDLHCAILFALREGKRLLDAGGPRAELNILAKKLVERCGKMDKSKGSPQGSFTGVPRKP